MAMEPEGPIGDVTDRFNALALDGFRLSDITYRSQEKLVLRLSDFEKVHRTRVAGDYYSDYELQFNRILGGRVNVDSFGPGVILRWQARRKSPELDDVLEPFKSNPSQHPINNETFVHFDLVCERGSFVVLARDFFLTVLFTGNA